MKISKMKKIVAIILASTMLMGMSLTANAANPPSPPCISCAAQASSVKYLGTTYEYGQIFYHWQCKICHDQWQTRVY